MKYISEFRDGRLARGLARAIAAEVDPRRHYRFMEFCGGHTHAVARYGIADLLPPNLELVHGPGCPVCVLPVGRVDAAITLAEQPGVTLCSYGDMLRVPGSRRKSLLTAKAAGADVRMVYSVAEAVAFARANPDREVVFFAIGFETTTPPTALAVLEASRRGLRNFSVFVNHVLTPAAMRAILADGQVPLDGFIGPAHVSVVIGSSAYEPFATDHGKPVVIAGFEPLDVLHAIMLLVRQVNDGRAEVETQYTRAVAREGNARALAAMAEVFDLRPAFDWRGLGEIPWSGLRLKEEYAAFDAERRFGLRDERVPDPKSCECAAIVRGQKHPRACKLFGSVCTPEHPIGACMVSSEGACAAYYSYGRHREGDDRAAA